MTYSQVKECLKDTGKDTLRSLIDQFGAELVHKYQNDGYSLEDMEEAYNGEWSSDEDFVQDLLESCGDIPDNIPNYIYIDWERTARNVMMDYFEIDGHYFRSL